MAKSRGSTTALRVAAADLKLMRAEDELRRAVAAMLPIGSAVVVEWGRGRSRGEVLGHCREPRYLNVRLHTGRIHTFHYSDVGEE